MALPDAFKGMAKEAKPMKKKKVLPEGPVKDAITKAFEEEAPEAFVWMPVPGPGSRSGIPDYVACVPVHITQDMVGTRVGLFFSIEAKADRKEPTAIQEVVHDEIRGASGFVKTIAGVSQVHKLRTWLRALVRRAPK